MIRLKYLEKTINCGKLLLIKRKYSKKILSVSITSVLLFISIFVYYNKFNNVDSVTNNRSVFSSNNIEQEDFAYLSDLDYIEDNNWSYAGYGNLKKDKNIEDGTISLIVNGTKKNFVKNGYVEEEKVYDKVHNLEYYDNILNSNSIQDNINNKQRLILEREFVNKIGYDKIQSLANTYPKYKKTLDWILSDDQILEQIIEVGEVNGTSFIPFLADLYTKNNDSLNTTNGATYQK